MAKWVPSWLGEEDKCEIAFEYSAKIEKFTANIGGMEYG
jgi:hypothetical protein